MREAAGWLALLVLAGTGSALRLARLDTIPLHLDALHPYYEALRILQGHELPWRGTGGGFRFGALQGWLSVPLVVLGGGLRQVLGLNALVHGLGAVPLGLAGRAVGGWPAGLAAAALYGAWPILVAHPHHGAYTYQAPVAVALAAWLLTRGLDGRARAVVGGALCLAAAVHLHPYALSVAAGSVVAWPALARAAGRGPVGLGALSAAVVLAPMAVDNWLVRQQRLARTGDTSLLQDPDMAARGTLEVLSDAALGGAGWHRWFVAAVVAAPLVALALAVLRRPPPPAGPLVAWAGAAAVAFAGLGAALGYVQPYHLAVWLPLGFLATAWALGVPARTRPWWGGFVAVTAVGGGLFAAWHTLERVYRPPALSQRHLGTVEQVTEALLADAAGRPRTLALVAESSVVTVGDNVAWHLEQWTRGEPDEAFPAEPGFNRDYPRAYVVAELSPAGWEAWPPGGTELLARTTRGDTMLRLLVFEELTEAAAWMRRACPLKEAGLDLRVAPPREALGGVAGTDGPHVALERWAEPCPHPTDGRWL